MEKNFIGVYSRMLQNTKTYFYVWEKGYLYSIQRLDAQFNPVDILKTIDKNSLLTLFQHEPSIKFRQEEDRKKSRKRNTKYDFPQGTQVEDTLREHFRKALIRLRRAETKHSALTLIQTLIEVEEGITAEHKHMFMDFAKDMRKHKQYNEALALCKRGIALAPHDDHAHFNIARVLIDMGRYDEAEQHLLTAQDLNDDSIYQITLKHIQKLRMQLTDVDALEKLLGDSF